MAIDEGRQIVRTPKGFEVRVNGCTLKRFNTKALAVLYCLDSLAEDLSYMCETQPVVDRTTGKKWPCAEMAAADIGVQKLAVVKNVCGLTSSCSKHDLAFDMTAKPVVKQQISPEIKREAEKLAEERMEQIKKEARSKAKITFGEVAGKFYALAKVGSQNTEESETVIKLAEKALYEEIKDGCIWGEA